MVVWARLGSIVFIVKRLGVGIVCLLSGSLESCGFV